MTLLYPAFFWLFIPLMILLWRTKKRDLITTVHLIILILIVTALSRPVLQEGLQERSLKAKDIIIALDVSYSMRAKDIEPTRSEFAKETIDALINENTKDNIMLIAFTTNPLLLSPPTTDHELIHIALKSLNPEYILTKGTSLKKLFKKIASMNSAETLHKSLLLITDGGEDDDLNSLTDLIQKANISLTVLALGTKKGTTIEKPDGTLLKDDKNNLVVSRINPLLKKLTSQVDGLYLTASNSPETTAKDLQDALSTDNQKAETITKMQYNYTELYQIFILFAALLFLMVHTRAAKYLIALFILLGINLQASILDSYHLNQAYQSYKVEDFNSSEQELKKIDIPSLQSQFALANTYYRLHSYKKAGSGGESKTDEKQSKEEKKRLILDESQEQQPLSSKVYELINKGYIRETQPW